MGVAAPLLQALCKLKALVISIARLCCPLRSSYSGLERSFEAGLSSDHIRKPHDLIY